MTGLIPAYIGKLDVVPSLYYNYTVPMPECPKVTILLNY